MSDGADLERIMRDGLERRADHADVSVPVARRAMSSVRRRHRGRIVVGLAAASVAAVAVVAAVDSSPPPPDASERTTLVGPQPEEWRTEYWADIQVDVPAHWGWGGAPERGSGGSTFCGHPGAYLLPSGQAFINGNAGQPYVGRPISQSDACIGGQDLQPRAPYVWFDAAGVEPGTIELDGGYVQETVEVNGSTLTVATDDPELRQQIIGSAAGGETCLSEVEVGGSIEHDGPLAKNEEPTSMVVCAYRLDGEERTTAGLTYAATVSREATEEYLRLIDRAGPRRDPCPTVPVREAEWVVLELTNHDGDVTDRHVVHLDWVCPGIEVAATTLLGSGSVQLKPDLARPWAVGGIPRVLVGPTGGKGGMFDGFIGALG